jgi:hypothetical protein
MNLLKSAFNFTKPDPAQRPLLKIYEHVKNWDEERAKLLGNNMHIVELVMDKLDMKVTQVEQYIEGLEKLMSLRLEEIVSMGLARPSTAKTESTTQNSS